MSIKLKIKTNIKSKRSTFVCGEDFNFFFNLFTKWNKESPHRKKLFTLFASNLQTSETDSSLNYNVSLRISGV